MHLERGGYTLESQNIEYKEVWKDECLKWICGFANARGGTLYIGKNDKGETVGLANIKKLLEDIPNKIRDVLGIIADVNIVSENNTFCLKINVNPSPYPVSYRGEYHYRSGSTKQQLVGQALNHFLLKKMGSTWDSVPIADLKAEELRNDSFDIFREKAILSRRIDEDALEMTNTQLKAFS